LVPGQQSTASGFQRRVVHAFDRALGCFLKTLRTDPASLTTRIVRDRWLETGLSPGQSFAARRLARITLRSFSVSGTGPSSK
jgi:hypothetical protein